MVFNIRGIQWQDGRFGPPYISEQGQEAIRQLRVRIPDCNYLHLDSRIRCSEGSNLATAEAETTFEELDGAISLARQLNYKILLRIRLRGVTSLTFVPPDLNTWFNNLNTALTFWADYCQQRGVELFCILNELSQTVELQNDLWTQIVSNIRALYSGIIVYNTNWWSDSNQLATKLNATWFNTLDIIGISVYPILILAQDYPPFPETPSIETLIQGYNSFVLQTDLQGINIPDSFQQLSIQHGKPVMFYYGLGSWYGSAAEPWASPATGEIDLQGQSNWFNAFFTVFKNKPWVIGASVDGGWQTNSDKDPNNLEFVMINKPTQQVVSDWYTALTPSPAPTSSLGIIAIGGLLLLLGER